jgi:hypothetical protein
LQQAKGWARRSTGRIVTAAAVAALTLAPVAVAPPAEAQTDAAAAPATQATRATDSVPGIPGLPTGVPPAATAAPPTLPEPGPAEWPFPSDFSQTEGTGLLDGGASLWTDFVYDDHGAGDNPSNQSSSSGLAPDHGDYTYPSGAGLDGNNADIFRAAVGYGRGASFWRIDWNTLPDPAIPIAEWTMTPSVTPADAGKGTTQWPAGAGLTTSTGIEYALVVTAAKAQLIDATTGTTLATYATRVDRPARSFIVEIPTSTLPVSGKWSVQLAAGLADRSSSTPRFTAVGASNGALPSGDGANVYNVTFRTYRQESSLVCPSTPLAAVVVAGLQAGLGASSTTAGVPTAECGNFWMENDQANTLTGTLPDVSKYSLAVDWSQLRSKASVPAPQVRGYSNRWYVTPLDLSSYGAGVRAADSATYTGPTYLGRIQPYAVYVPTTYDFTHPSPTPLTWVLHSLGANLNQYGTVAPSQLAEVCQDRNTICATTEGFSEGEWYYAEAEVDFWDVWHQLALAYDLDPDATTISGYSMGGWASYKLAEEYPDLFAQAEALEGPVICGERVYGSVQAFAGGTQCTSDGNSTPLLGNLRWIPYVLTCGGVDELVPVTGCHTQASDMMADGLRVNEFLYPAEDHIVFSVQNDFAPPDAALGPKAIDRKADPGQFSFTWYPDLDSGAQGIDGAGQAGRIGPSSDYWLSGLAGRNTAPGQTATVKADSAAIPDPAITTAQSTSAQPLPDPTPYIEHTQSWSLGTPPPPQPALSLDLANIAAATLDTVAAGLGCAAVTVQTDGPTALTLAHLAPGRPVTVGSSSQAVESGTSVVHLDPGTTIVNLCSYRAAVAPSVPESPVAAGLVAGGLGVAGLLVYRRRRTRPAPLG